MENRIELIWANHAKLNFGQQMQAHSHACHQLYYILSGSPVFMIDGQPLHTRPGTFFVIPAGVPHQTLPLEEPGMESYELKVVLKDPFLQKHLKPFHPPIEDNGSILGTLSYVVENWNCQDPQNRRDIDYLLSSLLLRLFLDELHYEDHGSRHILSAEYNQVTRSILAYIEKNFTGKFSLQELGDSLNYNKNYLCSTFSKNTGSSIIDYLNFVRVRQAVIFFAFYGQDVFTTCESTGFSNPSYFSRTFKAMVGVSPRSFRRAFSGPLSPELKECFQREPILNYRLCTMEEAFQSLQTIGRAVLLQESSRSEEASDDSSP